MHWMIVLWFDLREFYVVVFYSGLPVLAFIYDNVMCWWLPVGYQ